MHALLLKAASAAGIEPRIDFQADNPGSIRNLTAAGLGVALMAASTTTGPGAPVATCELVGPPEHPPITVITPREPTAPATSAFTGHVRREARQDQPLAAVAAVPGRESPRDGTSCGSGLPNAPGPA
jgi:DNA-binding transcriptional LysR family regulator